MVTTKVSDERTTKITKARRAAFLVHEPNTKITKDTKITKACHGAVFAGREAAGRGTHAPASANKRTVARLLANAWACLRAGVVHAENLARVADGREDRGMSHT